MPGSIWFPFRQGDRSEYLALYVLSALGVSIYVPRTEDIGVDFYCSLAQLEGSRMTFGSPFLVQVKSSSVSTVSFGGPDKHGGWRKDEIEWLFSQELPFFVCVVDKERMILNLYGTSIMWEARYTGGDIGQVSFVFGEPGSVSEALHPTYEEVPEWPESLRGKRKCKLNLGPPLVSITMADVEEENRVAVFRDNLAGVIRLEQQNITYRRLSVHFYSLVARYTTNSTDRDVYMYAIGNPVPGANTREQLESMAPILATLALNFKSQGKTAEYDKLRSIMGLLPDGHIRNMIKANMPELFDGL